MKGLSPSFFIQHGLRMGVRIEAHFVDVAVVREEVAVAFVELTSVGMTEPTKHHAVQRATHQKIRCERMAHAVGRDALYSCGYDFLDDPIPDFLRVIAINPLGPRLRFFWFVLYCHPYMVL